MNPILAIDPGASGGFALKTDEELLTWPMPEGDFGIEGILLSCECKSGAPGIEVWIEEVPTFAGRNIPGHCIAKLFGNARFIEGYLTRAGARIIRVKPQKWQKHFGLGTRKDAGGDRAWKRKLRDEAHRRFPTVDMTLATADALLILDYAMSQRGGDTQ